MLPKMDRKHCVFSADREKLLENAITCLGLCARAHDRILKVARTIADLEGSSSIEPKHLSEAIQYRTLDRSYWAFSCGLIPIICIDTRIIFVLSCVP
jgi:magnesium chelatase family protein